MQYICTYYLRIYYLLVFLFVAKIHGFWVMGISRKAGRLIMLFIVFEAIYFFPPDVQFYSLEAFYEFIFCEGKVLGEVNSRKRFILIKQYISTATRPLSMSSCYELRRMLRLHWVYKPKISIVILIFNNFLIYFFFVFRSPKLRHDVLARVSLNKTNTILIDWILLIKISTDTNIKQFRIVKITDIVYVTKNYHLWNINVCACHTR